MRKLLQTGIGIPTIVLWALMLLCATSNAQHVMLGLRAGLNVASESIQTVPAEWLISSHTGIAAGAQLDILFNQKWGIGGQILYDQKGRHQETSGGVGDFVLNYLEIPFYVKSMFPTGSVTPYIFAGPSFGFFLSGTATGRNLGSTSETTTDISSSAITSIDVSMAFGLGVAVPMSSGIQIDADLTYALGLTNVDNSSGGTSDPIHSRDLRIMAGVMFPIN